MRDHTTCPSKDSGPQKSLIWRLADAAPRGSEAAVRVANADLVPTDQNLRDEYASVVSGGRVWSVRLLGGEDGQHVATEDRDAAGQHGQSAIVEVSCEHRGVAGARCNRLGGGGRGDGDRGAGGVHFLGTPRQRGPRGGLPGPPEGF